MREIKFRGMSLIGEWFYGNLAVLTQKTLQAEAGTYISNKAGLPFAYQVRPETVGQYIGLKDERGKMVYEGDIIEGIYECAICEHTIQGVVAKDYAFGGWVIEMEDCTLGMSALDTEDPEFKIIGNEFENPELLK